MNFSDLVVGVFRGILWYFCQFTFYLMDLIYGVIEDLAKLNLGDFSFIWQWWKGLCILLFFFIILRMAVQYFKASINEDELGKVDPINLIVRLGAIALITLLLPSIMTGLSSVSSGLTENLSTIITSDIKVDKPSHVIASAGYQGDIETFDYNSIDINAKADGKYIQFPSSFDIIFAVVASVVADLVFVFIGIQIAQRIVGLLLKILISPFALSGLISPEDNTFSLWFKLCIADFLTGFFQIVLVMLVMSATASVPLQPIAKVIFFIGALMAVMNAPAGIAQLLGGDVGVGTAFQQMQSLMMLGTGAQMAGNAVLTAGSMAAYAGGRALGGRSLINGVNRSGGGGFGGTAGSGGTGGAAGTNPSGTGGASGQSAPDAGAGGAFSYASVPSDGGNTRMSRENTPLSSMGERMDRTPVGQVVNTAARSLYERSAARLSRNVQYRTSRGGMAERQSRIVTASHAIHNTRDAARYIRNGGNNGNDIQQS